MARIFICYRREDSSGHAGRLYDRLRARFGDDVFMDIDAIGPGVDYGRLIDETMDAVEALIVVIGHQWLDTREPDGNRRLDDPEDLVRQEISEALARDVLVIPVLVQGAVLPEPHDLPPDLVGLVRRNAFEVSDARWNYDADRLVQALETALSTSPVGDGQPTVDRNLDRPAPLSDAVPGWTPTVLAISGALLVLLFGLFVGPTWHNEQLWFRIMVALAVVVLAAVGLRVKRGGLVMAAGAGGLVGFGLWVLLLIGGGHDLSELMSLETDGVTNFVFLAGSAMLLLGGWLGSRSAPGSQPHTSL